MNSQKSEFGKLSRRTILRGLGVGLALPLLDGMLPAVRLAGVSRAADAAAAPVRLAFLYVPNGMHMPDWTPKEAGPLNELTPLLKPVEAFKDTINVFTNLAQHHAEANGDGPGDHARSMATYLTGKQAYKTSGADIKVGVSVDQAGAQQIGKLTKFASLELGIERSRQSGECDSGYSCAYSSNISWKSESTPNPAEVNPRLVFERLFGEGPKNEQGESRAEREKYQKSILDFAQEDARRLNKKLSRTDQRKLDEYLTSVRELEQRITRAEQEARGDHPASLAKAGAKPEGIPKEFTNHVKLMLDMLVLAWQTDSTRIVTFPLANEGSNKNYPEIEVSEAHHELSHHGRDPKKQEKISKINAYHMQHLAYLLEKLRGVREGDRTLLDNCLVSYGSCIGDGNRHNHNKLPILVAGRGGGAVPTGRHVMLENQTPLNNLWLGMLAVAGANVESLGDSTGHLKELRG
ncbi:MAG: DUF1552 domain-containing protein [Pirellulales bacterium]|nr:DUF1552 domain-containing protein [Pirellulales bacterium]